MSSKKGGSAVESAAAAAAEGQHSTAKHDQLMAIQRKVQQRWSVTRPFEAEPRPGAPKYMITFPYPYMNGRLHLGHGFSFSKCEFAARFKRMKGMNVLWGFGLHVTGTPIAACAQKLRNEMARYGTPPQFPPELLETPAPAATADAAKAKVAETGKHQGKRAKTGPPKPQWLIMRGMGIPEEEIPAFADPMRWLEFFPPLALEDSRTMGCHIDYRRSFITTDVNPYYDRFVQWQFRILQQKKLLGFGERYCIYSTVDRQPCADHDRASGEGVVPQEYVVVKLLVQDPSKHEAFASHAAAIGDRRVVLPGATLRAETVVGQTNCWVSPTVTYKAFEVVQIMSPSQLRKLGRDPEEIAPVEGAKPDVFITTQRCANNLAYQNYLVSGVTRAEPKALFEVPGEQLVGLPVAAPYAPFDTIYTLPMSTISDTKGTAIVMSVPSDSPDDYINFMTLFNKPDFRAKLKLKDEWVVNFKPVPIITIPGELGENSAEVACGKFKVAGPKDAEPLAQAKELCYNEGFYKGTMTIGPLKGVAVRDAKKQMADRMVGEGTALLYQEPQKPVTGRSGDDCVVALCDQWFLSYSHEDWKKGVRDFVKGKLDTFTFPGVRNGLAETTDWLSEWPCSRNFGLGTQMPGVNPDEEKIIVDSLSDSTIYMSYYTVAKYLHAPSDKAAQTMEVKDILKGTVGEDNAYGIKPEHMGDAAWDFILLGKGSAEEVHKATGLSVDIAQKMRAEFDYFYPCDLRTSGKDLIQNHLTMSLFNHAAVWENDPSKWIQGIYCNGHILVDGEKMSKGAGNFIILKDALGEFTADGVRLAFAEAGDSLNDANFVRAQATEHIMRLTTLIDRFESRQANVPKMRTGADARTLFDNMFDNTISDAVQKADHYYDRMLFQKAMQTLYFELSSEVTQYELACGGSGCHADVIKRLHDVWPRLLAPIIPHTAEHLWMDVMGNTTSINEAEFPTVPEDKQVDATYAFANKLLNDVMSEIRATATRMQKKKGAAAPTTAYIFTRDKYLPWQVQGLQHMQGMRDKATGELPADTIKQITGATPPLPWLDKKMIALFVENRRGTNIFHFCC